MEDPMTSNDNQPEQKQTFEPLEIAIEVTVPGD